MLSVKPLCICVFLSLSSLSFAQAPANHSAFTDTTPAQNCFVCHGSKAQIAGRTEQLLPNPHDSHRGFVECMECHSFKPDQKQILMCNDCHAFETKEDGFHLRNRKAN